MRTSLVAGISGIALVAAALTACSSGASAPFIISSKAMPDGSTVALSQVGNMRRTGHVGCAGEGRSPDIEWGSAPTDTKSYAVELHDPDAPIPGGVWHWVAFDIPASATSLPEGLPPVSPLAKQALNTTHTPGYIGPCPPPGPPHHYVLTVYALNVATLGLPNGTDNPQVRTAVSAHTLAQATLTGQYAQPPHP